MRRVKGAQRQQARQGGQRQEASQKKTKDSCPVKVKPMDCRLVRIGSVPRKPAYRARRHEDSQESLEKGVQSRGPIGRKPVMRA
jgi:hypothetical protein